MISRDKKGTGPKGQTAKRIDTYNFFSSIYGLSVSREKKPTPDEHKFNINMTQIVVSMRSMSIWNY